IGLEDAALAVPVLARPRDRVGREGAAHPAGELADEEVHDDRREREQQLLPERGAAAGDGGRGGRGAAAMMPLRRARERAALARLRLPPRTAIVTRRVPRPRTPQEIPR